MKIETKYCLVEELEEGDIFFTGREWGFCCVKEVLGVSFFTGKICLGLEPCDTKPKKYLELFFKMNKKVRLFD